MDTLKEAQTAKYVLGLKGVSGVKPRMEIDVMVATRPEMFNLLLLALDRSKKGKGLMDYPRVAGIHGWPSEQWDDIPNHSGSDTGGYYCTHGTQVFPTWHRPYVALIEQTLAFRMYEIANEFPENKRNYYLEAAKDFRLPYWDYYRPRGGVLPDDSGFEFPGVKRADGTTSYFFDFSLPRVFLVDHIMVTYPETPDKLTVMRNPLNTFRFPDDLIQSKDWARNPTFSKENTRRHPDMYQSFSVSRDGDLYAVLQSERAGNVDKMRKMMDDPEYSSFRRTLEGLHGTYHTLIGSGGHMSDIGFAAFDPIFWFHHCNIDRYLSIWQAINPPTPGSKDNWVSSEYDRLKWRLDSDLVPFRMGPASEKKFWKSSDTYDMKNFGYTYDDVEHASSPLEIKKRFNANYAWSLHKVLRPDMIEGCPEAMKPLDLSKAEFFEYDRSPDAPRIDPPATTFKTLARTELKETSVVPIATEKLGASLEVSEAEAVKDMPPGTRRQIQWYVNTKVDSFALGGTFTIVYFLGEVRENAKNWLTQPNSTAITHIFVGSPSACDNCASRADNKDQTITSSPLTPMLLDYKEATDKLDTLMPNRPGKNAYDFLKNNLHWRVRLLEPGKGLNPELRPSELPSLEVSVSAQAQYFQPGGYLPEYGPMVDYPAFTARA